MYGFHLFALHVIVNCTFCQISLLFFVVYLSIDNNIHFQTFVITAPAFLLIAKQQVLVATENPVNREEMDSAISESDRLCQQNKLKEAYEVLFSHKDVDDVNLQWRFARLCYRMGKMSDSKNPKEFAEMAMKHIDKAVALDSNSFNSQKVC